MTPGRGTIPTAGLAPVGDASAMRILVVDNYDSFTWNLVHLIGSVTRAIEVVRNDEVTVDQILDDRPDAVVLSPGPCTPTDAGICLDLVTRAATDIPIFGVCLGLQAIGQALGGVVVRAPVPVHGKTSLVHHRSEGLFRGINGPFEAARYHSLVVRRDDCPPDLTVTAETGDGLIMGLSHRTMPLHGVQFHPESIRSRHGEAIIRNFIGMAACFREANAAGMGANPARPDARPP